MPGINLGQVDYINCLPVYHALEENLVPANLRLVKGPPTKLNDLFLKERLDVTPISSIEYARNGEECFILPDMSISADGRVASILLFSKVPVTELDGRKVSLTSSSATSVALLKILFDHYYHVEAIFETNVPRLESMLKKGDGALLIGDDALVAHHMVKKKNLPLHVTDLGTTWQQFTGEKMVYAIWAIKKHFARNHPEKTERLVEILRRSRDIGLNNVSQLIAKAKSRSGLPTEILEDYFMTLEHHLGKREKKALLTFFDYAYKSDLLGERTQLEVWGESI